MNRRTFLLGAAAGFVAQGGVRRDRPKQSTNAPPDDRPVRVRAVGAETKKWLKGARVFVIAEDGGQLAEAFTDEWGIATLPKLAAAVKPRYVLVDSPWYFVTGRRWVPGLLEYEMLMLGLTPPGFLG